MTELEVDPEELPALAGLFAPDHVTDPYPVYARWRDRRPVARPHEYLFVLSRYEDCAVVLGDPAWGHSPANAEPWPSCSGNPTWSCAAWSISG